MDHTVTTRKIRMGVRDIECIEPDSVQIQVVMDDLGREDRLVIHIGDYGGPRLRLSIPRELIEAASDEAYEEWMAGNFLPLLPLPPAPEDL